MKRAIGMALCALLIGLCALSGCSKDYGTLYYLQDVYDAQGIDREDLLNIAYHNGDIERNREALQGFTPEPIGELDEKTAKKIRGCVAENYRENYEIFSNITAEDIHIVKYLGCYNEYYAVRFHDTLSDFTTEIKDPEDYVQEVDGIQFVYIDTSLIFLWKQN